MIGRERRRLRKAFSLALIAGAAPHVLNACTDDTTSSTRDGGARTVEDATPNGTVDAPTTDGADTADVVATGDDATCGSVLAYVDGGNGDAAYYVVDAQADVSIELCTAELSCGLPKNLGAIGCKIFSVGADGDADPNQPTSCWVPEEGGCSSGIFEPVVPITLFCDCDSFTGGGRRPAGLRRARRVRAKSAVGDYLARMAHAEAASVPAFEALGRELRMLGAPTELVRAASVAAREEVEHARLVKALARAAGAEPPELRLRTATRERDLEAIATENAVEGCIHETYGALVAHWQASRAGDAELRRSFARIARDESRHAALSWAVHRWLSDKLDAHARRRVRRAQRVAVARLRRTLERAPGSDLIATAGVPNAHQARALFDGMMKALES